MITGTLYVEGMPQILQKLEALQGGKAKRIVAESLIDGSMLIEDEAKKHAPVKSGKTKEAIHASTIINRGGMMKMRVAIGAGDYVGDTFYAAMQEYGWKTGARRNTHEAMVNRIARKLRIESRLSRKLGVGRGLARLGSLFRERQEKYFRAEAARQVAGMKFKPRRQIPGKHFMENAFEAKKEAALKSVIDGIKQRLEKV